MGHTWAMFVTPAWSKYTSADSRRAKQHVSLTRLPSTLSRFSGENAKEGVRKCSLPQALTSRLHGGGARGETLDVTVACSDCRTQNSERAVEAEF